MRTRSRSSARVSPDRWLVSYADFITLLFAFFVMMYSISSVDARKLQVMTQSMRGAFAEMPPQPSGVGVLPDRGRQILPAPGNITAAIEEKVSRDLAAELADHRLDLIVDRRGVTISIPEAGVFPVGNDELSDAARELMAQVAATVADFPNDLLVEGHADNVPIRTSRFRSNWDLSAARASRVVEFLIERGIEPGRLSATGYGEFRPRVANDSPASRAVNRRVDVVIATPDAAQVPSVGSAP